MGSSARVGPCLRLHLTPACPHSGPSTFKRSVYRAGPRPRVRVQPCRVLLCSSSHNRCSRSYHRITNKEPSFPLSVLSLSSPICRTVSTVPSSSATLRTNSSSPVRALGQPGSRALAREARKHVVLLNNAGPSEPPPGTRQASRGLSGKQPPSGGAVH